jgi:hypothetical protein
MGSERTPSNFERLPMGNRDKADNKAIQIRLLAIFVSIIHNLL